MVSLKKNIDTFVFLWTANPRLSPRSGDERRKRVQKNRFEMSGGELKNHIVSNDYHGL